MHILKKAILLALLPSTAALAYVPSQCIQPNDLHQAASDGIIHNIDNVKTRNAVKLNRWYSVGHGNYTADMVALMNPANQWMNGQIDHKDANGILCDYVATNYPSPFATYVDIQQYYKKP